MRLTMNVDCTPEEARAFLGLPDLTTLNTRMVERVAAQAEANLDLMNPNELLKTWMSFGGLMREQFLAAMTQAAESAGHGSSDTTSGSDSPRSKSRV